MRYEISPCCKLDQWLFGKCTLFRDFCDLPIRSNPTPPFRQGGLYGLVASNSTFRLLLIGLCPPNQLVFIFCRDFYIGKLQRVAFCDVDDLGIAVLTDPGLVHAVIQMDMAVKQIAGFALFQKRKKGLKTPMGRILRISHALWRRMGHNDVDASHPP